MALLMPTFGLIGIVLAMYAAAKFLRERLGVGKGVVATDSLKVVGKRTLEPKKSLYVVNVGERYLIVGASDNGVNLIDHLTAEEFATMSTDATQSEAPVKEIRTGGTSMMSRLATRFVESNKRSTKARKQAQKASRGSKSRSGRTEPMTVRESFTYFMGKARAHRGSSVIDDVSSIDIDDATDAVECERETAGTNA